MRHVRRSGYEVDALHNLSRAGKPLLVRYDLLERAGECLNRDALARRPADLWRYREFLPVRQARTDRFSSAKSMTPLNRLAKPGSSRKRRPAGQRRRPAAHRIVQGARARLAVSMAKELGVSEMAMPTNGNAGAAMAAYARAPESKPMCSARTTRPRSMSARSRARRQRLSRQRADQRLRQDRRQRRRNSDGLVRLSRHSKSRTGSRARRRWGSNWPSSSAGRCPT